jgi:hypothetical protein
MPTTNTSRLESETANAVPGVNYFSQILAATEKSDPEKVVNWSEWSSRYHYMLPEIMEVARQADRILTTLPRFLTVPRGIRLRSSITIPQPGGKMAALVSRDSKAGPFYSESHVKFRWGERPIGIAGLCATNYRDVFIPNLDNLQDLQKDLKQAWIPSTSKVGAIIGLPLLKDIEDKKPEGGSAPAVLTVSSNKSGFIDEKHLESLREISWQIEGVLLPSRILPSPDTEELVAQLFQKRYDSPIGKERQQIDSQSSRNTDQIINDVLSSLQEDARRGRKPIKAEDLLRRFKEAGEEGISMEDLKEFFDGESGPERNVTAFLAKLNNRYLNEHSLHIEGITIYRIIKKPH